MPPDRDLVGYLGALNKIVAVLRQSADPRAALDEVLANLVSLMGLETGWIFLADPSAEDQRFGRGFTLAAHYQLPAGMALDAEAWDGECECQHLCRQGQLAGAYGEVRCGRLERAGGDRGGLSVHASVPLTAGPRLLGILNVAGPAWSAFSPEALAMLENVGGQVALALERGRLFDLLQEQRIQEQAALLAFSNQLLGRMNLDNLVLYLVEEVRRLLSADACALLLPVDTGHTLSFRAASGWLADPVAAGWRVPGDESSAVGHAILTQQPYIVEDTSGLELAAWLPDWLQAEGFRSHAVVPLLVEGRAIGALALSMRRPRRAEAGELRLLRLMANQAAMALEQARLNLEAMRQRLMEDELKVARQIQLSLLPDASPEVPGWEFAAAYRPARTVGGDFYDFFYLAGSPLRLGVIIADVAGKGVPAALFMAHSHTAIRTAAQGVRSPPPCWAVLTG